jgi:prevent-host-death family protein
MKRVGTFEAKTHLSQLLDEVRRNQERIIIQRRGVDMAVLAPCEEALGVDEATRRWILDGLREFRDKQRPLDASESTKQLIVEGRKR